MVEFMDWTPGSDAIFAADVNREEKRFVFVDHVVPGAVGGIVLPEVTHNIILDNLGEPPLAQTPLSRVEQAFFEGE